MPISPEIEVTRLLRDAQSGAADAQRALIDTLYRELRSLARSRLAKEDTLTLLSPTSLVHESFFRLIGSAALAVENRRLFFSYASKVMRSVIVDYVRERDAEKRGGDQRDITLVTEFEGAHADDTRVLAVDRAMQQLKEVDQRCHDVVEMRYFAGLTLEECAENLGVSTKTVQRDWEKARMFLAVQLGD
jgi:RNA polymerase sigma factor (TIGR02999 family)